MTKFHGVTSIGLAAVAIGIGAVVMFLTSWVLGVVYLATCAAGAVIVLYVYCAKCPCKADNCGHVFPGKIATIFDRQPGPYTSVEMTAVLLALLLLLGLPQFWLWRYTGLLIVFWVLIGIAAVQARTVVCKACGNEYCLLNPNS
jgi:hypothetical protein